ncbi:MAG: oligoendopeptidase F, partial [Rhodospirillales bacterium]|nr:oligoendopeptidase F [Rhodospirillales bacterium]
MQAAKTDLPEWDLSHLYQGPDSKELEADLAGSAADAKAFRETYKGTLEAIDGAGLGAAVAAFEKIEEVLGKAMSYT